MAREHTGPGRIKHAAGRGAGSILTPSPGAERGLGTGASCAWDCLPLDKGHVLKFGFSNLQGHQSLQLELGGTPRVPTPLKNVQSTAPNLGPWLARASPFPTWSQSSGWKWRRLLTCRKAFHTGRESLRGSLAVLGMGHTGQEGHRSVVKHLLWIQRACLKSQGSHGRYPKYGWS